MRSHILRAALVVCIAVWATQAGWRHPAHAGAQSSGRFVRPVFDLGSPERSPFPSDAFTVADANQNTGRRVNLPSPPDCVAHASACQDVAMLNQLDGFNMQPRISLPFDGDIDPSSATSETIFLVRLRRRAYEEERRASGRWHQLPRLGSHSEGAELPTR